jgi:hypothetical protein
MNIISSLQFKCINESRGCTERFHYRFLLQHERQECKFKKNIEMTRDARWSRIAKKCKICNESVREMDEDDMNDEERKGQVKVPHLCSKNERELWCVKHRMTAPRYDKERVVNEKENAALASKLKCELCKNLLRKPMSCSTCNINFCRACIANELLANGDKCPSCE